MSSFVVECDGPDGLLLIDRDNLRCMTPEQIYSFSVLLDRVGNTQLRTDFSNEIWSDAWTRESALIRDYLNSGKGVIALIGGGDHNCEVSVVEDKPAQVTSKLFLPSGNLIALSASEAIQCAAYPGLEMDVPYQEIVDVAWYSVSNASELNFSLFQLDDERSESCENVLYSQE